MKPSFVSGYIEGYYGRLLTFAERAGIAAKLGEIGAGFYLYAPKEDPFHRRDWRKPYPAPWRKEFRRFVAEARHSRISVIPGIAPGLSYRYRHEADFQCLVSKFKALADAGCRDVALLMDDIPPELPRADSRAYRNLGEAHVVLLQRLQTALIRKGKAKGIQRLWFCPTVYCDAFSTGGVAADPYLRDLSYHLPANIPVLWTGPKIVSPEITPSDLEAVTRILKRSPVIWDNLYANDYCPGRIFLGPFAGRTSELLRAAKGLLLNPTGLYHTDLFLLDVLGGFLRGKEKIGAWKGALKKHRVPKEFLAIAEFLSSPFDRLDGRPDFPRAIPEFRKALKPLIWNWKSPLQREWYPYLYSLDGDLRMLSQGEDKPDETWIRKKYPPVLTRLLIP